MRRRTIVAAIVLTLAATFAGVTVSRHPTPLALPLPPTIEMLTDAVQLTPQPAAQVAALPRLAPLVIGAAEGDAEGWQHVWPGVQWRARFSGTGLRLLFDDPVNRYRIYIDGQPVAIVTRPGDQGLELNGLAHGPHDITVVKINESTTPARFGGFFLPAGTDGLPPPPAAPILIEFIGDSDTVGYGNTVNSQACTAETVFLATDISRSFGPRVATQLGADYRMFARSGIGLVRNYDGSDPGRTMATLYPATPLLPQPQVIVIGLGSNDFVAELHEGEQWSDADALRHDFTRSLVSFVRQRHEAAPEALIVFLAFNEYGPDIRRAHEDAAAELGESGITTVLLPLPKFDRGGCDWHPSENDHALIAQLLIDAIKAKLDL